MFSVFHTNRNRVFWKPVLWWDSKFQHFHGSINPRLYYSFGSLMESRSKG